MSAPSRLDVGAELRLAACAGLLAGYLDVLATAWRRLFVEPIVFVGRHQVWTAPVADLALYLVVGAGLVVLLALVRHPALRGLPVVVYTALAVLGALYTFPSIHRVAALLLATGVGVQVARWAHPRRAEVDRGTRRLLPWLAGATAVVAAGMIGWQALAERRALARLPAGGRTPNVLLIVLDTVRAMNLSLYGYARPTTPELDRRAPHAVRFTRAIAPGPWTLPSHAGIFTGRSVPELSADWMVPLDAAHPVLAEVLGRAGYRSAGFVGNTDYCSEEVGLARGFTHYEDYVLTPGQMARSTALGRMIARVRVLRTLVGSQDNLGRRTAPVLINRFLGWLDRDAGRPWFAFLNLYDAHRPYLPPAPFDTLFQTPGVPKVPRIAREHADEPRDPRRARGAEDAYDSAIAALDAALGGLFRELEARGALANTIVIVTADHGEEFLEHGVWDHGNTLYLTAVHVPLLIFTPDGDGAGTTVTAPVALTDLPATIMELAGLPGDAFPGRSLRRHWAAATAAAPDTILSAVRQVPRQAIQYPVTQGNMASLLTGDLRYIRNLGNDREELYAVSTDPLEQRDLGGTPAGLAARDSLRARTLHLFPPAAAPGD